MNYFEGCTTEEQRKVRFKELAKKHHPDLGGSEDVMKEINRQYNSGAQQAKTEYGFSYGGYKFYTDPFQNFYEHARAYYYDDLNKFYERQKQQEKEYERKQKEAEERRKRQREERKKTVEQLKLRTAPCRFCKVSKVSIHDRYVECKNCKASGPRTTGLSLEEAVEAWNLAWKE